MGLFSNMFGQAKELTKLGNAVANIKNMLDQYESDHDTSFLLVSAWICKAGVTDLIEKNQWLPNYRVYVPINGHQTKMYINEVLLSTIGRLKNKASYTNDYELEQIIDDILEGGKAFDQVDKQISQKIREIIC